MKILDLIEKYCSLVNPDEKDKRWNKLYRLVHSANDDNSCYEVHKSWRDEADKLAEQLKDV